MSSDSTVLDPMMGSGSFVHAAASKGMRAIGIDSDPLALLMAKAAVDQNSSDNIITAAHEIVCANPMDNLVELVQDLETIEFIDYWFDRVTQRRLTGMVLAILAQPSELHTVLFCALSRMIITKDEGVSRARDVSHSRPHVVRQVASYDPLERFESAVQTTLSRRIELTRYQASQLFLLRGDARHLPVRSGSMDAVMTSPPYLNAIDYLRGHRLTLVWMGYNIRALRDLRGESIGSERGLELAPELSSIRDEIIRGPVVAKRKNAISRYIQDLDLVIGELVRVLKTDGQLTFVVANSVHGGTQVSVDDAIQFLSERHGLEMVSRLTRDLPSSRRYLPPPHHGTGALALRMRSETILAFVKN